MAIWGDAQLNENSKRLSFSLILRARRSPYIDSDLSFYFYVSVYRAPPTLIETLEAACADISIQLTSVACVLKETEPRPSVSGVHKAPRISLPSLALAGGLRWPPRRAPLDLSSSPILSSSPRRSRPWPGAPCGASSRRALCWQRMATVQHRCARRCRFAASMLLLARHSLVGSTKQQPLPPCRLRPPPCLRRAAWN